MDTNDFRAKPTPVEAILKTQSLITDAWFEHTRRTARLLQESGLRQARLTRELLAESEAAIREMRPPTNSTAAIIELASVGWQTAQDISRGYGTLGEDIYRAITAGCQEALARKSEPER